MIRYDKDGTLMVLHEGKWIPIRREVKEKVQPFVEVEEDN